MQLLLQVTWETPCCQALLAGSWSYWTTGPRTQGCAAWQFQVGCMTGSCHWGAEQWGAWATKGPSWDSEHYLRHKQISLSLSFFIMFHFHCSSDVKVKYLSEGLLRDIPVISSPSQMDFFPLFASSLDMIVLVYIRLESSGSYFSLGITRPLWRTDK